MYLTPELIKRRWGNEDLRLATTLMAMDAVEEWTFDGEPEVEKGLKSLCDLLEKHGTDTAINQACHDFLLLLAYTSTGRALHILSVLDRRFGGAGIKLVQKAVELTVRDDSYTEGSLMVERLDTLRRIRSLHRIFSPVRMKLVKKALEEINDEEV